MTSATRCPSCGPKPNGGVYCPDCGAVLLHGPSAAKSLRDRIGLAIVKAFEDDYQRHDTDYDPDTCYRAADEVIALLIGELTGDIVTAKFHPSIIGPAEFEFAGIER